MRALAFTLLLALCSVPLAATVYRWVDDDGVVPYSDQPHPNAEKMQVNAAESYKPSALDTPAAGGERVEQIRGIEVRERRGAGVLKVHGRS